MVNLLNRDYSELIVYKNIPITINLRGPKKSLNCSIWKDVIISIIYLRVLDFYKNDIIYTIYNHQNRKASSF